MWPSMFDGVLICIGAIVLAAFALGFIAGVVIL